MLELSSITFKNIRSFYEEQTIDFSSRDNLIQIDGKNENTGGSSGAGKTSICLAIDYLLGISNIPSTLLQSRNTKEPMTVSGEFIIDGKPFTIKRSKKEGLSIKSQDLSVSGNNKLAEEKLDELIGIPRDILKKMVHKKQKENGFFLSMTPKEIYHFLVVLLGLETYISKVDTISNDVKEKSKKLDLLLNKPEEIDGRISELDTMLSNMTKPTRDVDPEAIKQRRAKISGLESEIKSLEEGCGGELAKLEKPVRDIEKFDDTKLVMIKDRLSQKKSQLESLQKNKHGVDQELSKITNIKYSCKDLIKKLTDINGNVAQIEKESLCYTCLRHWDNEDSKLKIDNLKQTAANYKKQLLSYKQEIEKEKGLIDNLATIADQIKAVTQESNKLNEALLAEEYTKNNLAKEIDSKYRLLLSEYQNKQNDIKSNFNNKINDLRSEVNELKIQNNNDVHELNTYEQLMKQYNLSTKQTSEIISKLQQEKQDIVKNKEDIQYQISVAEESKRLIKAYILKTFQETLDSIAYTATNMLSFIPNVRNSSIFFDIQKEMKNGSVRDEITPMININGENAIPLKTLCGGEGTAIDLAVDLAVIDTIESKTGRGANFFIMDEPFNGLDSVCKESCLDILRQMNLNKKIIMIDHSSELKEMVSDVITVCLSGENSSIL